MTDKSAPERPSQIENTCTFLLEKSPSSWLTFHKDASPHRWRITLQYTSNPILPDPIRVQVSLALGTKSTPA
jgi:hypothetical protein